MLKIHESFKFMNLLKISSDALRFYLISYCDFTSTNVTQLTRSELVSMVESAELSRRPKRPFCLVLGVAPQTEKWSYFRYTSTLWLN